MTCVTTRRIPARAGAGLALALLVTLVSAGPARAQFTEFQLPPGQTSGGSLQFGPGFTTIDDKNYLTFNIEPELAFGKLGFGLSIPLLYDLDESRIREIDWDSSRDYARIIRYVRWGVKRDPLYVRVGELSNALLGHGFTVYYYNNNVDDNYPKRGMQLDIDFGKFGFETMIGNFGRQELYGGRGYIRPLQLLDKPVPIVKNFGLGATFITDRDSRLAQPVNVFGLDLEQPIVHVDMADLYLYFDYSNISNWDSQDHGSGIAYGIATDIRGIAGLFQIGAKFEMRHLSEGFTAGLISPLWDIKKADIMAALPAAPKTNGWYGELVGTVIGRISLRGTYFETGDSVLGDQFVLHADANKLVPGVALQAFFVKQGIQEGSSLFTLDNNAMTIAEVGYRPYPFMTVLMRYEWSYVWDDAVPGYVTQKRVEPRVQFGFSW